METRSTRASRKDFLYFLPLLAIVLGVAFLAFGALVVPETHPPFSPLSEFLWYGAQVLILLGITVSVVTIALYITVRRAAKASQQSRQAPDLSNHGVHR